MLKTMLTPGCSFADPGPALLLCCIAYSHCFFFKDPGITFFSFISSATKMDQAAEYPVPDPDHIDILDIERMVFGTESKSSGMSDVEGDFEEVPRF